VHASPGPASDGRRRGVAKREQQFLPLIGEDVASEDVSDLELVPQWGVTFGALRRLRVVPYYYSYYSGVPYYYEV
jgi:hypothetical protein